MSESGQTKAATKVKKSTHRPSKTPTGLPGDEPKAHRHKRHREKLGEVVDTLLVPEHKAARRIIRRSQRRNPQTGIINNMTLYERIMAYRKLKQKDGGADEINEEFTEDELRKLERSDTGWGSVDISQITNRKDDDEDRRSPTPQPTLTDDVSSRRHNQTEYTEQATARDVIVDVDDGINKKEPIPPIRSTTPQKKRTPTPNAERSNSRQSDINKHTLLPPIQDTRQDKVEEKYEENVKTINNDKYVVDDRQKDKATIVAATAAVAKSEKREERERREEEVRREEIEETRKTSVKECEKYENERQEDRREISDRKNENNEERSEKREEKRSEKREDRRSERYDERDNVKKEEREDYKKEYREERESERVDKLEEKNERYDKKVDKRETDVLEESTAAAVMSSQRRSATPKERTSSPRASPHQRSRQPRAETPQTESSPSQRRQPVVQKQAAAAARRPVPEARKSPTKKEPTRSLPKRKTSMDDEIDRLDKIVDRDLNDIISSLGKKGTDRNDRSQKDDSLKQKILDPSFQADMDRYLRDI